MRTTEINLMTVLNIELKYKMHVYYNTRVKMIIVNKNVFINISERNDIS